MTIEFDSIVRDTNVIVYASGFFEEHDVGIHMHPEELYAKTLKGKDFALTDKEEEELAAIAIEMYWDRMNDDDMD